MALYDEATDAHRCTAGQVMYTEIVFIQKRKVQADAFTMHTNVSKM